MTLFNHLDDLSGKAVQGKPLHEALTEIASRISKYMSISRLNVWIFKTGPRGLCIECLCDYDSRTPGTENEPFQLYEQDIPTYFKHLRKDSVIPVYDILNDPVCAEFKESYSIPYGIKSLMDIPLRADGELMGVICFEDTERHRNWTEEEQNFGWAISQVMSSIIVSEQRQQHQIQLAKTLEKNELLMSEVHHQVKGDLSILVSLIRIKRNAAIQQETIEVLSELESKIFSVLKLHDTIFRSGDYTKVNLRVYLQELTDQLSVASYDRSISFSFGANNEYIPLRAASAVIVGLAVSEAANHAMRYAFDDDGGEIAIYLEMKNDLLTLSITDNGKNFVQRREDNTSATGMKSVGLELLKDLATQINGKIEITENQPGTSCILQFPADVFQS